MVVIINGMLLGVRTSRPAKTLFDAVTRRKYLSTRHYHNRRTSNSLKRAATKICIVSGVGVCALSLYNLTAECKQEEDIETKANIVQQLSIEETIVKARDVVQQAKDETGSPGLVVGVSIDGKTVWAEGLGYADVENRTKMSPDTVLRIASISKSITMAAVAKQWELGTLDLDKPVQYYVPSFPEKQINGVKVTITTRQLVSHMAGIRHYRKDYMKKNQEKEGKTTSTMKNLENNNKKSPNDSSNSKTPESQQDEMELDEYYIMKSFRSVTESLSLFKDDPLLHSPGSSFFYTTHGWTLISAVLEAATKEPFEKHIIKMVRELGMNNTYLDENSPLIYHRGRHYVKDQKGKKLINAPYVDLSYKWAGGGLLSTIPDLLQFGNVMLYSFQHPLSPSTPGQPSQVPPGFLTPETMRALWIPLYKCSKEKEVWYGMGWFVDGDQQKYGQGKRSRFRVSHTGNAVGGSSVLLILPPSSTPTKDPPKGVVVAIIVNMTAVNLSPAAEQVAELFENFHQGRGHS